MFSQTPSRSGHPSSFTLFRILSSARFATSCSAAFRCKKVLWDLYRAPSTHTVDLNLGIWAGPSLKVWYTGSCKDDFCVYSCRRFLYIRLSGRPEKFHADKIFNPSALSNIIKLSTITYKTCKHQTKCKISMVGGRQTTIKIHEYRIINVTCTW